MAPTAIDPVAARRRFVAWMAWYMESHPADAPTRAALARLLHLTEGGVSQLLADGSTRSPSFENLIAAASFLPHPLVFVLSHDPPQFPVTSRKR